MNELLLLFVSLSLSGSVLVLLLLALRPLTRKRLSQSWQYYIWLIVLLRFLLPITPQVSLAGEAVRSFQGMSAVESIQESPALPDGVDVDGAGQADRPTTGIAPAPGDADTMRSEGGVATAGWWSQVLAYAWVVWLGVALVLVAYKAATYRSFERFARAGAQEVTGGGLYDLWQDELAFTGVKRPLPLLVNDLVGSPMLIGLRRSAVVLTSLGADAGELRQILRHELIHYRRRDVLFKWLAQLVLCLHWFNPLAYLMVRQVNKACELACDEAVVKGLDAAGRGLYGDALIASLRAQGSYSNTVVSITMSEDANSIKERLDAIAGYRRKPVRARLGSAALTLVMLSGFLFTGAYAAVRQQDAGALLPPAEAAGQSDWSSRASRGHSRAPDTIETVTARADRPVDANAAVTIVIDAAAAVDLVPTSAPEFSIDYDRALYTIEMEEDAGEWRIRISYVGTYSIYPAAMLYLPDVVYGQVDVQAEEATVYFSGVFRKGGTINARLEHCSVFYTIPANFAGTLNAYAPSSYLQLHAAEGYGECDVIISNCNSYGQLADGFTMQGNRLVSLSGAGTGAVNIDMGNNGYVVVESGRYEAPAPAKAAGESAGGLTLVEREFTIPELRERKIQGVKVVAASEEISVTTGGSTLKLQYYESDGSDYTLETVSDRGGLIEELYLFRSAPVAPDEPRRTIRITIPDGFDCDTLLLSTADGEIRLDHCDADTVILAAQSGGIGVDGGVIRGFFAASSASGSMDITGVSLPGGEFSNSIETDRGTVRLRLPGASTGYDFKIDAGRAATIEIGGQHYDGGSAFTVNGDGSGGTVRFTSEAGTLLVLDA